MSGFSAHVLVAKLQEAQVADKQRSAVLPQLPYCERYADRVRFAWN
ncbi:MAG: hypothetical protein ABR508_08725 [Candidatus Baltobacteraceae bacterium]